MLCVVPVWTAGNHQYGALSRVWQVIGIELLLLVAGMMLVIAAWLLVNGVWRAGTVKIKRMQAGVTGVLLLFAGLDWSLIFTLVLLKKGLGLD